MIVNEAIDLFLAAPKAAVSTLKNATGLSFAGAVRNTTCVALGAAEGDRERVLGYMEGLLPKLRQAHVFFFGGIPFKPEAKGAFQYPGIDYEDSTMFQRGIARAPFPVCWFEFEPYPGVRRALLVEDLGDTVDIHEFVRHGFPGGHQVQFHCFSAQAHRDSSPKHPGDVMGQQSAVYMTFPDPFGHFRNVKLEQAIGKGGRQTDAEMMEVMMVEPAFAIFLLLVLRSNKRTVEAVKAKPFANRRRANKGLAPEPDHHRVVLPPGWAPGELPEAG